MSDIAIGKIGLNVSNSIDQYEKAGYTKTGVSDDGFIVRYEKIIE